MKIEVLGTGCPKCKKTTELMERMIEELGLDAELVHVSSVNAIVSRGVMMTPAVVIDGEIKFEGRIPDETTVRSWFTQ